jgi:hypothetical protein
MVLYLRPVVGPYLYYTQYSTRMSLLHVSGLEYKPTPQVFHTYFYFYKHACRLRLKKLLYLELSRSPNGFFKLKSLLDPGGRFAYGGFRGETVVT